MDELTPAHVQTVLDRFGIQMTFFQESTATSQLAADQIGCELGQIAKSILFLIEEKPVLVIASGDQRVDDKKLAALHNVNRKKVKVGSAAQCVEITGYAPGGVPPFGHRMSDLTIYLDDSMRRYELMYAAGGAHNAIFPITVEQLQSATGGTFADVKKVDSSWSNSLQSLT